MKYKITAFITMPNLVPMVLNYEGVEIEHAGHVAVINAQAKDLVLGYLGHFRRNNAMPAASAAQITVWRLNDMGNSWVEIENERI